MSLAGGELRRNRRMGKFVEELPMAVEEEPATKAAAVEHTLTGLGVSVEEELALKWFEWVQTGLPMTMLSSLFGHLRLTTLERKRLFQVYVPWALQCGTSAKPLMNVYFEELLKEPISSVRKELGIFLPTSSL